MRKFMVMVVLLVSVMLLACSSTDSGPTEEGLRERAEAFATAATNGKWIQVHRFYTPDFQERCPSGEFAIVLGMGMAMLKGMMGIDENEELEYHVTAVTADGLNGLVTSEMHYHGEALSFGDSEDFDSEQWVFIDGEWWYVEDEEGCPSF